MLFVGIRRECKWNSYFESKKPLQAILKLQKYLVSKISKPKPFQFYRLNTVIVQTADNFESRYSNICVLDSAFLKARRYQYVNARPLQKN